MNNGRESQLPYKNLTNEKFFFVAFAQVKYDLCDFFIWSDTVDKNSDIYHKKINS